MLSAALATLHFELVSDEASERSALTRLGALMQWWPGREGLALCLAVSDVTGVRALLELATGAPDLPLLAVVERGAWQRLKPQLDARSRDLLDADTIRAAPLRVEAAPPRIAGPQSSAAATSHDSAREAAARTSPIKARASDAVSQVRAMRANNTREGEALIERARSLAEQRLFELLQADPVTRDLFVLNGLLPFTFGSRKAEVDFVCVELRLAVEVDGYHHFKEHDAYRRDRRKDVLLQHHGYLVSRLLASDVVERETEVVNSIRKLVSRRRRTFSREDVT
jgi:hypothetical protein